MMEFRVSAKALKDLRAIGRYTQRKWGKDQRNKYLSMLDAGFHTIAHSPEVGINCEYIRSGYRKYYVGRHLIFYRHRKLYIEIIRILHDRMDISRHFRVR
jgi:toxin ParE1/3/4